jgi:hypothetical protein
MGFGRFLRRNVAGPVSRQIERQSELLCEMHLRQLLSSAPYNLPNRLEPYGFRSFSQNDEDGIIQEIFRRIGVQASTFVEFGVQNGLESNTRLLLYRGWKGLWMEADGAAVRASERLFAAELSTGQLKLANSLVTKENINGLIESAGLGEIDLLSVDIDGNDYWIWDALTLRPRLVIVEYNAKVRPPVEWVMQYAPAHRWNGTDYFGVAGITRQARAQEGVYARRLLSRRRQRLLRAQRSRRRALRAWRRRRALQSAALLSRVVPRRRSSDARLRRVLLPLSTR